MHISWLETSTLNDTDLYPLAMCINIRSIANPLQWHTFSNAVNSPSLFDLIAFYFSIYSAVITDCFLLSLVQLIFNSSNPNAFDFVAVKRPLKFLSETVWVKWVSCSAWSSYHKEQTKSNVPIIQYNQLEFCEPKCSHYVMVLLSLDV